MATYSVRLFNPEKHLDHTLAVSDDQYILDVAQDAGIRLPWGCLQGECSVCVAKLVKGQVNQSEQTFLQHPELEAGYIVTCVAYPRSDCEVLTHQEHGVYPNSLYLPLS